MASELPAFKLLLLFKFSSSHKEALCQAAGVEGWSDAIIEKITATKSGIPSPSNMTWDDRESSNIGQVPKFTIAFYQNVIQKNLEAKKLFSFADKIISANVWIK